MITNYKIFEDTQIRKFEIPEQIRKYYVIEGDMSNSKNWKSTKYFQPFTLYDKYKESGLGIRYILISLNSNHIIPINMNDEHQTGYDVLYNVFYDKYKVPREKYISVCSWGNHYIWNMREEKQQQLQALTKFLEYGGNPNLNVNIRGGNSNEPDYEMTASAFVEFDGNLEEFKKKTISDGKISPKGEEFISFLSKLGQLWRDYTITEREEENEKRRELKMKKIGEQIIPITDDLYSFIFMNYRDSELLKEVYSKFYSKLKDAVDKLDVNKVGDVLFTHNGIKNFIHIQLKEPRNKYVKEFFWNVKKAKIEFDRLSNL